MSSETDGGGDSHATVDGDEGADIDSGGDVHADSDGGDVHADSDGGDIHDPERVDNGSVRPDRESARPAGEPEPDGFGRRGWALTAVLFTCVLVIPGIIYAYPYAAGALGFTFFATYLALPLVPALLLGLVAVWSMTAATTER